MYAGPAAPRLGCRLVLVLEGCACATELVSVFSALVDAVGVAVSDIQATKIKLCRTFVNNSASCAAL